jgi:hypothetical protein
MDCMKDFSKTGKKSDPKDNKPVSSLEPKSWVEKAKGKQERLEHGSQTPVYQQEIGSWKLAVLCAPDQM